LLTESGKRDESAADARKQRRRWGSSLTGSLLVHLALVGVLCWPVAPRVLAPRLVARGEGGNAMGATGTVLYLPSAVRVAQPASARERAALVAPREDKLRTSGVKQRSNALEVEHPSGTRQAGSTIGTSYAGLWSGDEIKPALPSVFPDLTIHRNELPAGVEGDVIVEVTIDAQGNRFLRTLLVEAAQSACRYDEGFQQQYRRRCHSKPKAVAKLAAARKLAVRLFWMMRTRVAYPEIVRIGQSEQY